MVPGGKAAVARVYLLWLKHANVYPPDIVDRLEVDFTLTVDGQVFRDTDVVNRPDLIAGQDRLWGENSINIKHVAVSGFDYHIEITPMPQSNAVPLRFSRAAVEGDAEVVMKFTPAN